MAATKTVAKLTALALRRVLDFDPDSGSAVVVDLVPGNAAKALPLAQFRHFLFGIMRSVGTGQVTAARIIACTASDGTGTVTTIVAHAGPTTADAVGDTIWLECDAEQAHEVLSTAAYVGLEITLQTSTDECVVYAEARPMPFEVPGLTADYIS